MSSARTYRPDAVASFVSGYHLALLAAAGATLAAAAVAVVGLRSGPARRCRPASWSSRARAIKAADTAGVRHRPLVTGAVRQPGRLMRRRTRRLPQAPSSVNSPESRAAQYSS